MYISDIIKQARNNLKSRKSTTIINVGLLFFSLLVIIASEMFSAFYSSGLGQVFDGVEGRTLKISYFDYADDKNMTIEKLYDEVNTYFKEDNMVELVEISYGAVGSIEAKQLDKEFENKEDIGIALKVYNSAYEKYLLNDKNGNLNKGEIYIPKYLNIDNEYLIDSESKIEYTDGDKYIGKTIKIDFTCTEYVTSKVIEKFQKEFIVVGTYDNFSQGDFTFCVLGNIDDMKEIQQRISIFDTDEDDYKNFMENFYKETGVNGYEYMDSGYMDEWKNFMARTYIGVIVKEYKDMDDVEQKIVKKFGPCTSREYYEPENKEIIDGIVNAVRIAGYVLIVVSAINITFSMIKSILKRKKEFAILSAVGYKNKSIYNIIFCEMIIIVGIALVASFVIYGIGLVIINSYIANNFDEMYSRLSAVIPAKVWLTRLGLLLLGMIIAQLFSIMKVKSIVPAKELKEE